MLRTLLHKPTLLLFLLGFLLYLPSLSGQFLWDDEDFVYANRNVLEFRLDKFFVEDAIAGRGKVSNYFRPLPQIVYASTNLLFRLNPFWFHLVSVFTHLASSLTIYYFLKLLLLKLAPSFSQSPSPRRNLNPLLALLNLPFLVALLFLAHPIQTETVSYVSGLSDSLFVLFGSLSVITFLLREDRFNMLPLSTFFFVLALLSKETAVVFLPLLILLAVIPQASGNFRRRQVLISTFKLLIPYLTTTLIYLWYHFSVINRLDVAATWKSFQPLYASSLPVRLLTFIQNLFLYVSLILFPKDLHMERDLTVSIQTQLMNPYLFIFLFVIFLLVFLLYHLRQQPNLKLLLFFALAFFITLVPYSGIVLINGIFYEHFLYLPLVFFFAFFLTLLLPLLSRHSVLAATLLIAIFITLGTRNIIRQLDWTNPIRFYTQTLVFVPQSIRARNGLGMAFADENRHPEAIKEYKKALSLDPTVPHLYHNLGNSYEALGNFEAAENSYLLALKASPQFVFSRNALIRLYKRTNQSEKLKLFIPTSD